MNKISLIVELLLGHLYLNDGQPPSQMTSFDPCIAVIAFLCAFCCFESGNIRQFFVEVHVPGAILLEHPDGPSGNTTSGEGVGGGVLGAPKSWQVLGCPETIHFLKGFINSLIQNLNFLTFGQYIKWFPKKV